ncbi:MAG: right-handed parallel beta-helix repeat-containing protein [Bacteroidota bacterium]
MSPTVVAQDLLVDTTADDQTYNATTSLAECTDATADGDCTLREAILVANANTTLDAIGFDVTADLDPFGEAVIIPSSDLPAVTDPDVSLDGYTQTGASRNTLADGSNAVLVVVLFNAGSIADGLQIGSAGTGVRIAGLSIIGFDDDALDVGGDNAVVEGNFIGVAPDGTAAVANDFGVFVDGADGVRIGSDTDGDVGERNVISGNEDAGILAEGPNVIVRNNIIGLNAAGDDARGNGRDGVVVLDETGALVEDNVVSGNDVDGVVFVDANGIIQNNRIGTDVTGTAPLSNGDNGLFVVGSGSTDVQVLGNLISGNAGDGVEVSDGATGVLIQNNAIGIASDGSALGNLDDGVDVEDSSTASILGNSITNNGSLGIQLEGATDNELGVTPNDVGDSDGGPNGLLNFPVLTAIAPAAGGGFDVTFSLSTVVSEEFWIEVFASDFIDESGHGEGETLLATTTVTTDGSGEASATVTVATLTTGQFVTFTATEYDSGTDTYGATSEFSAAVGTGAELSGAEGYRMLALPGGGTVDDLLGNVQTTGFPGSDTPASSFCSAYFWDETQGSFDSGYTCVGDQEDAIAAGEGLFAYIFEDDDPNESGTQGGFPKVLLPSGPGETVPFSAFSVTYTGNPDTPAVEEGWNLLGNPLSTALAWDFMDISGGLTNTIYVYDPDYLGGNYRTWTQDIGGDLPDGEVPAFQAFFAKAAAANPALEVSPCATVASGGPDVYGKASCSFRSLSVDLLRLELARGDEPVSVAFVALAEGTAIGVDARDAFRLTPGAWPRTVLSTSDLSDGNAMALNALPTDTQGPLEIPLSVTAEGYASGPLSLSLTWTGAVPDGWQAELVDRYLGTRTPLVEGGTYAFTLDIPATQKTDHVVASGIPAGPWSVASVQETGGASTDGRFTLVLTPGLVTNTETETGLDLALSAPVPNPARRTVRIGYSLAAPGPARISLIDALGREVALVANGHRPAGAHEAQVDISRLSPGVYVVRLVTEAEAVTTRLTVVR